MYWPALADQLVARGHDVIAANTHAHLSGIPDDDVFAAAQLEPHSAVQMIDLLQHEHSVLLSDRTDERPGEPRKAGAGLPLATPTPVSEASDVLRPCRRSASDTCSSLCATR
jgi:hypothetical protein